MQRALGRENSERTTHMRMSRRLTVLAALAVLGGSACSSGGDGDVAAPTEAAMTEAGPGEEQAAASSTATGEDAPTIVQPGAPGEPNRILTAEEAEGLYADTPHTWADVRFMQMMVPHHAQALEMVTLVEDRTASEDLPLFARRLEISQDDELRQIRAWLEERGEAVPDPADAEQMRALAAHDHGDHGASEAPGGADAGLMPGMLTEAEMTALEHASGAEFDRLWIESMIRHHQGALTMVDDLFTTEGAGQETEVFRFANHVLSDQQIEISRMQGMLAEMDATP